VRLAGVLALRLVLRLRLRLRLRPVLGSRRAGGQLAAVRVGLRVLPGLRLAAAWTGRLARHLRQDVALLPLALRRGEPAPPPGATRRDLRGQPFGVLRLYGLGRRLFLRGPRVDREGHALAEGADADRPAVALLRGVLRTAARRALGDLRPRGLGGLRGTAGLFLLRCGGTAGHGPGLLRPRLPRGLLLRLALGRRCLALRGYGRAWRGGGFEGAAASATGPLLPPAGVALTSGAAGLIAGVELAARGALLAALLELAARGALLAALLELAAG
jgi:hypothetical protein